MSLIRLHARPLPDAPFAVDIETEAGRLEALAQPRARAWP